MTTSMRSRTIGAAVLSGAALLAPAFLQAQGGAEVFTAMATVKTAAGATASAPLQLSITRKTPQAEVDAMVNAFKAGGAAGLKKALVGVGPTGTVQIGTGASVPTRLTVERVTGAGRLLLTVVTDQPLLFLGASLPGAKATGGYDFAVIDIEIDEQGSGSGTLAPAAKLRVTQGALVVDDYGVEGIRLVGVKRTR
jgi:hypothetical protein